MRLASCLLHSSLVQNLLEVLFCIWEILSPLRPMLEKIVGSEKLLFGKCPVSCLHQFRIAESTNLRQIHHLRYVYFTMNTFQLLLQEVVSFF